MFDNRVRRSDLLFMLEVLYTMSNFVEITCPNCSVLFGMTESMREVRERTGDVFFCPNGHTMNWKKKLSDVEKENIRLKIEIEILTTRLNNAKRSPIARGLDKLRHPLSAALPPESKKEGKG